MIFFKIAPKKHIADLARKKRRANIILLSYLGWLQSLIDAEESGAADFHKLMGLKVRKKQIEKIKNSINNMSSEELKTIEMYNMYDRY